MCIFNKMFLIKLFLLFCLSFVITQVNSLDCYINCRECINTGNLTNQNCTKCKDGYYLDLSTSNCYNCYNTCETCNQVGNETNNNCLSCKTGYYKDELTSNCNECCNSCLTCIIGQNSTSHNCLTCKNGYYFSSGNCNSCNSSCKTCSNYDSCDSCASGYLFLYNTQNCIYSSIYPNYYVVSDKYLKQCDEPCYQCSSSSSGDNHNCLSCIYGYFYKESSNN